MLNFKIKMKLFDKLFVLIFVFFSSSFFLCSAVKLICHRQHDLASWLSPFQRNDTSFVLKCKEDMSRSEHTPHQVPSQITIVRNSTVNLNFLNSNAVFF